LSGSSGGLFFHITSPAGTYAGYLFEIDATNGNYRISRSPDFSLAISTHIIQDWTASAAIKKGSSTNTLRVLVQDGTLSFSINNVFLLAVQDTTYGSGTLAFLATATKGEGDADMVYSNLRVYQVS
jgi:hypothetical protein